jgi:hypothetical protein
MRDVPAGGLGTGFLMIEFNLLLPAAESILHPLNRELHRYICNNLIPSEVNRDPKLYRGLD